MTNIIGAMFDQTDVFPRALWIDLIDSPPFEVRVFGNDNKNLDTPRKINMEHNNGGLEDDFPFQIGDF